jgi:hypothetical protein
MHWHGVIQANTTTMDGYVHTPCLEAFPNIIVASMVSQNVPFHQDPAEGTASLLHNMEQLGTTHITLVNTATELLAP